MPGYFVPISSLFSDTTWDWSACRPIDSDEVIPTSDTNEVELELPVYRIILPFILVKC